MVILHLAHLLFLDDVSIQVACFSPLIYVLKSTSAITFNKNQHLLFPSLAWQIVSLTYMRPCIDPNMHTIEDQYLTSHLLSTGIPRKSKFVGQNFAPPN